MKGGYILLDCENLDLTAAEAVTKTGFWNKAVKAIAAGKPMVAYNCVYGTGVPVSPVTCFGWYISSSKIVIVGATLHIEITDQDAVTIVDVAAS